MTEIAKAYAQGLYALAKEENLTEAVLEELTVLEQAFAQESGFLRLLAAPDIAKQERCGIIDSSFRGKVQPYVLNFLKILTEKGYIRHFPGCVLAYRDQYNQDNGIVCVRVISAQPLSASQTEKLTEKLTQVTGKTISLDKSVDPEVLGGIRLDYDGKRVDGTVRNRLDSISKLLKNTML